MFAYNIYIIHFLIVFFILFYVREGIGFVDWLEKGLRMRWLLKCLVSQFGLAVMHWASKQKGISLIPLWLSLLFKEVVICRHCLLTLSLTINETLKWLLPLPILMKESFWWWQCSNTNRYINIIYNLPVLPPSPIPIISIKLYGSCGHKASWKKQKMMKCEFAYDRLWLFWGGAV